MAIDGVGVLAMDSGAGGMSDEQRGNPLLADLDSHMSSNGFVLGMSGGGKSFNPVPTEIQKLVELVKADADGSVGVENAPFNVITRSIVCFGSPLGSRLPNLAFLEELTHADGTPARFRELFEDPSAHSFGGGSGECDRCLVNEFPWLSVYALEHESDLLWQDRVAHALVECHGLVGGGHTDDDVCVMVCGPAFAEQLDLSSDALAPVSGQHGDARHVCDVPDEGLRGFVYHHGRFSAGEQCAGLRGYVFCWSEERGSYECFVSERPYESRPERAVVLDGHAWDLLAESYGDLIGEQPDGFLCLQFVFHGPDNDFRFDPFDGFLHRRHDVGGGGAMV